MNFEQDYIMRMIKAAAAALARIIFQKSNPEYEFPVEGEYTAVDDLYERLLGMADAGHINEAENLLYQKLDRANLSYLEIGIGFYNHLNGYEDDFLSAHDYTREEIGDGIRRLLGKYGMEALEEFVDI